MQTIMNAPEIRHPTLDLETQALLDDSRVREIDQQVRESWSELAAIAIRMRDRQGWKHLPQKYESFDAWLLESCPTCRATVYTGMGVFSVLSKDLDPKDIREMEIGNARLLAYEVSSSKVRRDPEVIAAAKSGRHTKALRETVKRKFPDQHLEDVVEKKLHFTSSQWDIIELAFNNYLQTDPKASLEVFFEAICAERIV